MSEGRVEAERTVGVKEGRGGWQERCEERGDEWTGEPTVILTALSLVCILCLQPSTRFLHSAQRLDSHACLSMSSASLLSLAEDDDGSLSEFLPDHEQQQQEQQQPADEYRLDAYKEERAAHGDEHELEPPPPPLQQQTEPITASAAHRFTRDPPAAAAAATAVRPASSSAAAADAASVVAEVYSNLSQRARPFSSSTLSTSTAGAVNFAADNADALASPQPVRSAPRPHMRGNSGAPSSQSLDEEFGQARQGDAFTVYSSSTRAPPRSSVSTATSRAPLPLSYSHGAASTASAVAASQTRTSLHTSSGAILQAHFSPALSPASLDSSQSRLRWLEQRQFLLGRLGAALDSKRCEVGARLQAVQSGEAQRLCERQMNHVLQSYIAASSRKLQNLTAQIHEVQDRVQTCNEAVETELHRFDALAQGGEATEEQQEDPQHFARVAHDLEEQVQSILATVAARDNFKLDGGASSANSSSSTPSSALPPFDPFQVAKVRELEADNARLKERVRQLELGATQVVELAASAVATGGHHALSASERPPRGPAGATKQVVSLHETQGIIVGLQQTVEELSAKYAQSASDLTRLQTEHSSLLHTLQHERTAGTGAQSALLTRVADMEAALRSEQASAQKLQECLSRETHAHSTAAASLANLESTAAAAALAAHKRDAERNAEVASLRSQNQRAFERAAAEAQNLRDQLAHMRQEHVDAERTRLANASNQADQNTQQLTARFQAEKEALSEALRIARAELEQSRSDHAAQRRADQTEMERHRAAEVTRASSERSEASRALQEAQRDLHAKSSEIDGLRHALQELRTRAEARASQDLNQSQKASRTAEEQSARIVELQRSWDSSQNSLKNSQKNLEASREAEATLHADIAQLQAQLKHSQDIARDSARSLKAAQEALAESLAQKQELQESAKQASDIAASNLAKLRAAETALQLLEQRSGDQLRQAESENAQVLARENDLSRKLGLAEAERARAQAEAQATQAKLEAQLAAITASMAALKTSSATARAQQDAELARMAALQVEAVSAASGAQHAARIQAQIDLQAEVAISRFVGSNNARLAHLARAIAEHTAIASNLGLLGSSGGAGAGAGDGTDGMEDAVALSSLRQAVSASSSRSSGSVFDSPVYSEFGSGSSMQSLGVHVAPLALPASKLAFEGLVGHIEVHLMSLLQAAQDGKRRMADRYRNMIQQMKIRAREQLAKNESDHNARLAESAREHTATTEALRADFASQLNAMVAAREALEAQRVHESREAAAALESATHEGQLLLQEEREASAAHFGALLDGARAEHERAESEWEQQRAFLEADLQKALDESARAQASLTTKLAGAEQEAQERLRALQELEAVHRASLREQDARAAQSLQDSLELFQRQAGLELAAVKHEAREALERADREAQRQEAQRERMAKDAQDAIEIKYVAQITQLQTEHDAAIEAAEQRGQALRESLESAHGRAVAQMSQRLEECSEDLDRLRAQAQEHEDGLIMERQEHARTLAEIQDEHERTLADMQHRSMNAMRNVLQQQQQLQDQNTHARISVRLATSDDDSFSQSDQSQSQSQQRQQQQHRYQQQQNSQEHSQPQQYQQHYQQQQSQQQQQPHQQQPPQSESRQPGEDQRNNVEAATASSDAGSTTLPANGLPTNRSVRSDRSESGVGATTSAPTAAAAAARSFQQTSQHKAGSDHSSTAGSRAPSISTLTAQHDAELAALQQSLLDSSRQSQAMLESLQLQLVEQKRESERMIGEKAKHSEQDVADLRSALEEAQTLLEQTQSRLEEHRSLAQSLAERLQELTEAHALLETEHKQLQTKMDEQKKEHASALDTQRERFESELQQQRSTLVTVSESEAALRRAEQSWVSGREEVLAAHAAERKRWDSLTAARSEEAEGRLQALQDQLQDTLAMGPRQQQQRQLELDQLRQELQRESQDQLQACREHYENLLRLSDYSVLQQQESLQALEGQVSSLQAALKDSEQHGHEAELQALHEAHLGELQGRLEKWRDNRRRELEGQEAYVSAKMDSLKLNQLRREEALCNTCRTKIGATSFRAALNRLCDEAAHFVTNAAKANNNNQGNNNSNTINSPPSTGAASPSLRSPTVAMSATPVASSSSSSAAPTTSSSVRANHSAPPLARPSPSSTTPAVASAAVAATTSPPASIQADSPNSAMSTAASKYNFRASSARVAPTRTREEEEEKERKEEADEKQRSLVSAGADAISPPSSSMSRQEGVLTLRFHAPTPTAEPVARTRVSFTPAPSSSSGASAFKPLNSAFSTPSAASAAPFSAFSPSPVVHVASTPTPTAPSNSANYQSMLDQYLANYQAE